MLPMQPGDVVETYADISESERDLGFQPATRIEEGIASFINWYKSYYGEIDD
jgi:UDP-glucuronate 4-epimerase